jgi:hypothetical protein
MITARTQTIALVWTVIVIVVAVSALLFWRHGLFDSFFSADFSAKNDWTNDGVGYGINPSPTSTCTQATFVVAPKDGTYTECSFPPIFSKAQFFITGSNSEQENVDMSAFNTSLRNLMQTGKSNAYGVTETIAWNIMYGKGDQANKIACYIQVSIVKSCKEGEVPIQNVVENIVE